MTPQDLNPSATKTGDIANPESPLSAAPAAFVFKAGAPNRHTGGANMRHRRHRR